MDFSSQLANLQKTANAAASSSSRETERGGRGGREPSDRRRHHDVPYHLSRGGNRRHGGRGGRPRYSRRHEEPSLREIIANLPPYRPSQRLSSNSGAIIPHVALLFITIDDLPYEEIWREWASYENQTKAGIHVSALCHAKHPKNVRSDWLKQRLLVKPPIMGRGNEYEPPVYHTHRPEWGSIEITRAMIDLVQEGLRVGYCREPDPRFSRDRYLLQEGSATPVDKFIFCSETCLPIDTLENFKAVLFDENGTSPSSWIHARDTPNNGYSRQLQFDKVSRAVPNVWKADQWMVLSRSHASALIELDDIFMPRDHPLWRCFEYCKASDEIYFPTALALLGIVRPGDNNDQIKNRRVTYADWNESAKNPASFAKGKIDLKEVAKLARKEGCLFARKFSPVAPGVPKQDKEPSDTGMITALEWKNVMAELDEAKG